MVLSLCFRADKGLKGVSNHLMRFFFYSIWLRDKIGQTFGLRDMDRENHPYEGNIS